MGGDQSMNQELANGEASIHSLVGGPPISSEHPMGSNEVIDFLVSMPVGAGAQYVLNPAASADYHAIHGVPAQALSINTHLPNVGGVFPSPNSATADTALYPNITEPQPSELLLVGSNVMRIASSGRRGKAPLFSCRYPGCAATFTAKHNYNYHMNSHYGLRPYVCPFEGCDYVGAAAPRTLKRHMKTCSKFKPSNGFHA